MARVKSGSPRSGPVGLMCRARPPSLAVVALLAVVITVLAACTTATSGHGTAVSTAAGPSGSSGPSGHPSPSPSGVSSIKFSDCSGVVDLSAAGISPSLLDKLSVGCGPLSVPADYSHPNAGSLSIAVIRIHYEDQTD